MQGHHHHQHHHHHQQQQQHHPLIGVNVDTGSDRFPQWSVQETKEFLMIRAELDRTFMETKRNKVLWEVISTKMKEKGYNRSAEQCKCKWKNLATRYKGCEMMELESARQQFPFYNELQTIFTARMQRMLWAEPEGAAGGGTSKKKSVQLSSDDEDDNEEMSEGEKTGGNPRKKKKSAVAATAGRSSGNIVSGSSSSSSLRETLEEFMKQQMQMEMQWREAFEARENERRMKEMEWRQRMEALENERIMMDRSWREREEERRIREEARAEKRDALITALLSKLRRDDNI